MTTTRSCSPIGTSSAISAGSVIWPSAVMALSTSTAFIRYSSCLRFFRRITRITTSSSASTPQTIRTVSESTLYPPYGFTSLRVHIHDFTEDRSRHLHPINFQPLQHLRSLAGGPEAAAHFAFVVHPQALEHEQVLHLDAPVLNAAH